MSSLREAVIKLASDKPELRQHLVPILQKTAVKIWHDEKAMKDFLNKSENADPKKHKYEPLDEKKKDKKEESKPKNFNESTDKMFDSLVSAKGEGLDEINKIVSGVPNQDNP